VIWSGGERSRFCLIVSPRQQGNGCRSSRRSQWLRAIVAGHCQCRSNSPQIRRSKSPQFCRSEPRVDVAIFRRPTPPLRHWRRYRRGDYRSRADVLGHQFGMLAQPVARTLDLHDDGVVKEPVEQCGGDDRIAEDVTPLGEAAVGCEYHGAAFVACGDELEKQIAAAGHDRQVADLIDDQQRGPGKEPDAFVQSTFALGTGELAEPIGQCAEIDAMARLYRLDTERNRQMAFSRAGRPQGFCQLSRLSTRVV
jgi:hypothetical protein